MIYVIMIIAALVVLNNGRVAALLFGSLAAFWVYDIAVHYDVLAWVVGIPLGILGAVLLYRIVVLFSKIAPTLTRFDCISLAMIVSMLSGFLYYGLA